LKKWPVEQKWKVVAAAAAAAAVLAEICVAMSD